MKRVMMALLVAGGCAPQEKPADAPVAEKPAIAAPQAAAPALAADEIAAPAGEIVVTGPATGARVTSPLVAQGSAINTWFFEGQFVAKLEVNGAVVAQGPAMQAGDKAWTDPGMIDFRAEMAFDVAAETPAVLVLTEDMPAYVDEANDVRGPGRTVRVPVTLVPAAK